MIYESNKYMIYFFQILLYYGNSNSNWISPVNLKKKIILSLSYWNPTVLAPLQILDKYVPEVLNVHMNEIYKKKTTIK